MGIDLFLAGLMLICLDGQTHCPKGEYYPNTVWVVKADGVGNPCGWESKANTTLELRFESNDFKYEYDTTAKNFCQPDPKVKAEIVCAPLSDREICVYPMPATQEQRLEESLRWLPRLGEIDRRFKELRLDRINDPYYVPTRVHFPTGVIGAGPKWPKGYTPRLWFRSNMSADEAIPRELSDSVRVTYGRATRLEFRNCQTNKLLVAITRSSGGSVVPVTLRNRTDALDYSPGDSFDDLTYLLWYYRLGSWDTRYGYCPEFSLDKKDAVLLRCYRDQGKYTRCSGDPEANTRFWPPLLGIE